MDKLSKEDMNKKEILKNIVIGIITIVGFPLWLVLGAALVVLLLLYSLGEAVRGLLSGRAV